MVSATTLAKGVGTVVAVFVGVGVGVGEFVGGARVGDAVGVGVAVKVGVTAATTLVGTETGGAKRSWINHRSKMRGRTIKLAMKRAVRAPQIDQRVTLSQAGRRSRADEVCWDEGAEEGAGLP
jgi:hypothetical protein